MGTASSNPAIRAKQRSLLTLGALGVVYGDIGTSPLYALRECFATQHGIEPTPHNVLGILSLIFWALTLVISIKYIVFVLRADNSGEGGILALMELALGSGAPGAAYYRRGIILALGLFGAALLYGDGMITPAISVLSAVEGLKVATHLFEPFVIPITLLILFALAVSQKRGTGSLGGIFGPIILVWFSVLGVLGAIAIAQVPQVLQALNPYYAVTFMENNRGAGFLVLGSVFLVVTGGEALYADMGHFGKTPIRIGWFFVAMPGLLLNYFGQGALILDDPNALENPFYALAPQWALYPLVVLATFATVIASQAMISGAFSLTRQAILLGYLPRTQVKHTSEQTIGQIYMPAVNWTLMLAAGGLVIGFKTSSNLAAAYGVAVTMTMVITSLLLFVVMRRRWNWHFIPAVLLIGGFLMFDLSFFSAAISKIAHGGWFPIVIALLVYTMLTTWRRGRKVLQRNIGDGMPLELFVKNVMEGERAPVRVPGPAVFMSSSPTATPRALGHNIKHNKVVHDQVVVLTILVENVPHVPRERCLEIHDLGYGFSRVIARYGFMGSPDVPDLIELCREKGLDINMFKAAFFLGREHIISTKRRGMMRWRERLFIIMSRNAQDATGFFGIPSNQVIELGLQVEI